MRLSRIWKLIKETFSEWSDDKVPRLSAALAYYTIFSIAPILVIAISIASLVFGREAAQGQIVQQMGGILGRTSAQALQEMIAKSQNQTSGIIGTAVGLGALLFGATGLFAELHDSLNVIWEVKPKSGSGILQTLKERFLSFTMVLGVGFLLLVSLVISAGLSAFGHYFSSLLPGFTILAYILNFLISFAVITLLFAMIYKILPEVTITWRDVWIGAASTALLFVIGKFAIGLYLGKSSIASSYGAAGALVLILLWVYYAAQILFLGAEFTQVYSRYYGSRIVPSANAVPLTENTKAKQGMQPKGTHSQEDTMPVPVPLQRDDRPALGSIGSLIVGLFLGIFYAFRRRKEPY